MAKATAKTEITGVTLELTTQEAQLLRNMLGNTVCSHDSTAQRVFDALVSVGFSSTKSPGRDKVIDMSDYL